MLSHSIASPARLSTFRRCMTSWHTYIILDTIGQLDLTYKQDGETSSNPSSQVISYKSCLTNSLTAWRSIHRTSTRALYFPPVIQGGWST